MRVLSTCLTLMTLMTLCGCTSLQDIHLNDPVMGARARETLETFEKIDFEGIIEVGLANSRTLTEAEIETRREFNRVRRGLLLSDVIGGRAQDAMNVGEATGWLALKHDCNIVLASFDVKFQGVEPIRWKTIGDVLDQAALDTLPETIDRDHEIIDILLNRGSFRSVAAQERQVFDGIADEYKSFGGTLDVTLERITLPGPDLEGRLSGSSDSPELKGFYRDASIAAARVHSHNALVGIAQQQAPSVFKELRSEIDALKGRNATRRKLIRKLKGEFQAAEKTIADARKANEPGVEKPSAEVVKERQAEVGKALEKVKDVLKQAEKADVPFVTEAVRSRLIVDLIGNVEKLNQDVTNSEGRAVVLEVVDILRGDPAVKARLAGEDLPSVNALLLELAMARTRYHEEALRQSFEQELLALRESKLDSYLLELYFCDQALAAVRDLEKIVAADPAAAKLYGPLTGSTTTLHAYFKKSTGTREEVIRALSAYAAMLAVGESRRLELDAELAGILRARNLEASRIGLLAWRALITAPIHELVVYHEGGITAEELGGLLNAAGLAAIAWGVN